MIYLSVACCADRGSQGAVPSEAEEWRVALADMEHGHPTGVQKADLTEGSDVHTEELHERHREKEVLTNQSREEDESPLLTKPGRKVLMYGAVTVVFERYQLLPVAMIKLPSKKGLHSNYNYHPLAEQPNILCYP